VVVVDAAGVLGGGREVPAALVEVGRGGAVGFGAAVDEVAVEGVGKQRAGRLCQVTVGVDAFLLEAGFDVRGGRVPVVPAARIDVAAAVVECGQVAGGQDRWRVREDGNAGERETDLRERDELRGGRCLTGTSAMSAVCSAFVSSPASRQLLPLEGPAAGSAMLMLPSAS
jgi:hypothetical protein